MTRGSYRMVWDDTKHDDVWYSTQKQNSEFISGVEEEKSEWGLGGFELETFPFGTLAL